MAFAVLAACSGRQSAVPLIPVSGPPQGGSAAKARPQATTAPHVLTGRIIALITGGFTIEILGGCGTNNYAKLHVYTNSTTTMSGPAPKVNYYAQVTPGGGTCHTSVTAAAVTVLLSLPTNGSPSPSPAPPTPTPMPSPTGAATAAPSGSPIPLQSGKTTHASTIASLFTGGFLLNPTGSAGYMHVYTNGATTYNNGAPATGQYVQATGSGPNTDFVGSFVSFSSAAPPSVAVSGVAQAATSYGFTLNVSSANPAVPIVMNNLTVVGGAPLLTGATVKVTGIGTVDSSILAKQIVVSAPVVPATPTPSPISQQHVLTGDYLGSPYGTTAISWSAAAPYLSWAQVSWQNANAVSAAGIKTQYYVDPNTSANDGDSMYTSDETTFAHDCNGNRISYSYDNLTMYQMDIGSSSTQSLFARIVSNAMALAHFDAAWEDNAGPLSGNNFSVLPCGYSDSAWLADGEALNQSSPLPVIFNGLSSLSGHDPSLSLGLLSSSNTIGGNYEHCYSDTATPKMTGWLWQAIENTELQVASAHKLFECQLRNTNSAATQTDARIYALASFLLTYDPATSILWEQFATPSGLHVLPESKFILLAPKIAAPSSVTALQLTGGTYGREYGECFYAGQFVGPCAVVINPDPASAHPFPFPQYGHTLVLSGSGVLDGGSVSTSGPAPALSLPAGEAAVVFP